MIIILSKSAASAVCNVKMTTCCDEHSLSLGNSNPMQIKLSDFSLNLYLVCADFTRLLLFSPEPVICGFSLLFQKETVVKSAFSEQTLNFLFA